MRDWKGPALAVLLLAGVAQAQDDDAGVSATEVNAIEARATRVRQLVEGTLDPAIDPQSLFDVSLHDQAAVRIEALRLEAILSLLDAGTEADDPLWSARLALDRARLSFLSLDETARERILTDLQQRRDAPTPEALERARLLEAARTARTEAERAVAEEITAILTLKDQLATLEKQFKDSRAELVSQHDVVLGWQRRLKELGSAGPEELDATYDSLRAALRRDRDELSQALDALSSNQSQVPAMPPAGVDDSSSSVSVDRLLELRADAQHELARAREEEKTLLHERATTMVEAISTLNRERLALLPQLSDEKREQITGFTAAGFDQAHSEARHLLLLLRYHQRVTIDWVDDLRAGRASLASSFSGAATLVRLILLILGFLWVRSRTPRMVVLLERRMIQRDRLERRTEPSLERRLAGVLSRIHRPLEWLAFLILLRWLLPNAMLKVLEVEIFLAIFAWVVGGSLVVRSLDAFATELRLATRGNQTDALRLRSLRLVGNTVVVFGVVLFISSRLVGQGTIFGWVLLASWIAVVPVFLILVRWWQPTVFTRLERARKKNAVERWVLAHNSGWMSFLAAMAGALELFTVGVWKTVRAWTSSFAVTRRASAWLFRRELDRREGEGNQLELSTIDHDRLASLHPSRPSNTTLTGPADELISGIAKRVLEGRGGILAIVGAQGMGKSTVLRRLQEAVADSVLLGPDATAIIEITKRNKRAPLVLLDDMQTFVKPVIGGLAGFDEVMNRLRADQADTVWVLAFDSTVWPFLARARDARPLFDQVHQLQPWTEEQLGELLDERSKEAGFEPSYEQLLDALPANADEFDRLDAVQARSAGYVRMLWDHVRGNPGLALEAWRHALGEDAEGGVHVRPLQEPDTSTLERLPDSSLFVLRAVLQLAPASVIDVAHATRLSRESVVNAMRFGQAQGFFIEQQGRYRVTWRWMRAVLWLLERRHLLVNA